MDGMMYYNPYLYGPMYFPDPWRTTAVPHHFPEHHYPLEKTRHAVGTAISSFGHALLHPYETDPPIYHPKADIFESEMNYYIDLELPGVGNSDHTSMKWLSSRTLLVSANSKRRKIEEDSRATSEHRVKNGEVGVPAGDVLSDEAQPSNKDTAKDKSMGFQKGNEMFLTVGERTVGKFVRAFSFPTAVDHSKLTTRFSHGILRVTVPKIVEAPTEDLRDSREGNPADTLAREAQDAAVA